jgi:exonuclease SbcC
MILGRISLKPFGGISSKEIRFRPNLNVVLGPNEAGKTTVFEAIQHALFTPSNLKPSHFSREMERFLPVGSGDTICVELEFSTCGKRHVLKRRWGETHASELILPDGSVVSRDEEIARFI